MFAAGFHNQPPLLTMLYCHLKYDNRIYRDYLTLLKPTSFTGHLKSDGITLTTHDLLNR